MGNGETVITRSFMKSSVILSNVNSHGGQKEVVFKYFIEIQMQAMKYNRLHVKFANFGKL